MGKKKLKTRVKNRERDAPNVDCTAALRRVRSHTKPGGHIVLAPGTYRVSGCISLDEYFPYNMPSMELHMQDRITSDFHSALHGPEGPDIHSSIQSFQRPFWRRCLSVWQRIFWWRYVAGQ